MQTTKPLTADPGREARSADPVDEPVHLGHLVRVLHRYRFVIALIVAAVLAIYGIGAIAYYLRQPAQKTVEVPFRLEFEGVSKFQYPNGARFSSSDIVSTPVLVKVFEKNDLSRFMIFENFKSSILVVESNGALNELERTYGQLLSDTRLNPVDRARLQSEYETKKAAMGHSEFSIRFFGLNTKSTIPGSLVVKALDDILRTWSERAVSEAGVLRYKVRIVSPAILDRKLLELPEPVIALDILRSRTNTVLENIQSLSNIPGSELVRAGQNQLSLEELRVQLDGLVRFRIRPMINVNNAKNPSQVRGFFQSQLAFNEYQLNSAVNRSGALRNSLDAYNSRERSLGSESTAGTSSSPAASGGETVMPQISESFIDRLVSMASRDADRDFRQRMIDRLTTASIDAVPYQAEIAFYRDLLDPKQPSMGTVSEQELRSRASEIYSELDNAIRQVNLVHNRLSENLNQSGQLYSVLSPAITRVDRAVSPVRLILFGLLLFLMTLPLAMLGSLLHHRIYVEDD